LPFFYHDGLDNRATVLRAEVCLTRSSHATPIKR
jgi:hypothetical protein